MNKITVIFFATFRDKAGVNRTEMEVPEGISVAELKARIDSVYPEDQATGFELGALRGAFTITKTSAN